MTIPIQNIYYLLCYSWNELEIGKIAAADADSYSNIESLLAKALVECGHVLFKRGLMHDYTEVEHEIAGIKGRIEFNTSMRRQLFRQGRAYCRHDDFTTNILANQILKYTIQRLIRIDSVDRKLHKDLRILQSKLQSIQDINVQTSHFHQVSIHRNNSFYGFILNICELIYHSTAVQENGQAIKFNSFLNNREKMSRLFESFIRNFYRREQRDFASGAEVINWKFAPDSAGNRMLFPRMKTDITLTSAKEKRILEVKYYPEALVQNQFGMDRFRSGHLYQLHAYLTNLALDNSHPGNAHCMGILIYPTAGTNIDEVYMLAHHTIRIYTLNLNQPWQNIHADLLSLLK